VLYYLNTMPVNTGGETVFYAADNESRVAVSVQPAEGAVCLHVHGDECLLHRGGEVRVGTKYILRTDLVFSQ
jgi:hypothetical protein